MRGLSPLTGSQRPLTGLWNPIAEKVLKTTNTQALARRRGKRSGVAHTCTRGRRQMPLKRIFCASWLMSARAGASPPVD